MTFSIVETAILVTGETECTIYYKLYKINAGV